MTHRFQGWPVACFLQCSVLHVRDFPPRFNRRIQSRGDCWTCTAVARQFNRDPPPPHFFYFLYNNNNKHIFCVCAVCVPVGTCLGLVQEFVAKGSQDTESELLGMGIRPLAVQGICSKSLPGTGTPKAILLPGVQPFVADALFLNHCGRTKSIAHQLVGGLCHDVEGFVYPKCGRTRRAA